MGMSDGINVDGKMQSPDKGRKRWELNVEEENDIAYFRVLPVQIVPGMSALTKFVPFRYYVHMVPGIDLIGKPTNYPVPVFCLGSPKEPDAEGNYLLTDEGSKQCSGLVLRSGKSLHSYGQPDPYLALMTYVHVNTSMPVGELRNWRMKFSEHAKSQWSRFRNLYKERMDQGGTYENTIWTIKRVEKFIELDATVAHQGHPWAERFPFGEQQMEDIRRTASECLKFFLPPHTPEQIMAEFKLDPHAQSMAPEFESRTAGPSAPKESIF